jgi:hypothetical protein
LPVVTVLLGLLTGLRGTSLAALTVGDLEVSGSRLLLRAQVLKRRLQPRAFADWVIPLHLGDVCGAPYLGSRQAAAGSPGVFSASAE